ncbi:MAG TPA: hypothetical protein VD735_00550, partial [Candidatus Saccharimonadales bacterium]|nr:hypothetical protein [Candidatus Saccharimonadales bacterium]
METFAGYYQERSGYGAAPTVEALVAAPEFPLSPAEKAAVYAYEAKLFATPITEAVDSPSVGDVL